VVRNTGTHHFFENSDASPYFHFWHKNCLIIIKEECAERDEEVGRTNFGEFSRGNCIYRETYVRIQNPTKDSGYKIALQRGG
jgi:hypothetical protein